MKNVEDLKVAVLMGGVGSERDVSLQSGKTIAGALEDAGVNVVAVDFTPDELDILDDKSIDVFFPALHGKFGEDGKLQQIFEDKNLAYVGSGPKASKLAFNKVQCKKVFAQNGISVARDVEVTAQTNFETLAKEIKDFAGFVVKPIKEGSSVGVTILTDPQETVTAAKDCLESFGDCMIEEFIAGREVTVGVINSKAMEVIEIVSNTSFYDYYAKYVDEATDYCFDTIEDKQLIEKLKNVAEKCFAALGCRHLGRVDMIITDDNQYYVLEINTLPGFTSHSLLPMAAEKAGLTKPQLCLELIKQALTENGD